MKSLIAIIISGLLFACKAIMPLNSQSRAKYQSLKQLKNDTITYVKDNFVKRKDVYIGKSIGNMLGDMEVNVLQCTVDQSDISKKTASTLMMSFYTNNEMDYKVENNQQVPFLKVVLQDPINTQNMLNMVGKNRGVLGIEEKNFLKDLIIKDIYLNDPPEKPHVFDNIDH